MRQPRGIEILDAVTARALEDPTYRQSLLDNPRQVLSEAGLQIPADVEIVIHQNTPERINLVLPSQAPETISLKETDITILASHTGGT